MNEEEEDKHSLKKEIQCDTTDLNLGNEKNTHTHIDSRTGRFIAKRETRISSDICVLLHDPRLNQTIQHDYDFNEFQCLANEIFILL